MAGARRDRSLAAARPDHRHRAGLLRHLPNHPGVHRGVHGSGLHRHPPAAGHPVHPDHAALARHLPGTAHGRGRGGRTRLLRGHLGHQPMEHSGHAVLQRCGHDPGFRGERTAPPAPDGGGGHGAGPAPGRAGTGLRAVQRTGPGHRGALECGHGRRRLRGAGAGDLLHDLLPRLGRTHVALVPQRAARSHARVRAPGGRGGVVHLRRLRAPP